MRWAFIGLVSVIGCGADVLVEASPAADSEGGSGGTTASGSSSGGGGDMSCLECGCWDDVPIPRDDDSFTDVFFDDDVYQSGTSIGNGGVKSTMELSVGFVKTMESEYEFTVGLNFNLDGLPKGVEVVSARLFVFQHDWEYGDDLFDKGGVVTLSHVQYGGISGVVEAPAMGETLAHETFAADEAAVWRSHDVTLPVRYQLASCDDTVQFKLAAEPAVGMTTFRVPPTSDDIYEPYIELRYRSR